MRLGELLLGAAVFALVSLATLGRLAGRTNSWWLLVGLVGASAVGGLLVVALERARRAAVQRSMVWRHGVNVLVLAGLVAFSAIEPPTQIVHTLKRLLADERATQMRVIRHQVYAAYRRMDLRGQRKILERSRVFDPSVAEAAAAFGVSHELLMGMAATESSFHPRRSSDGGRGLFQITAVPRKAEAAALRSLGTDQLDPVNQRHNAFVAAATLTLYAEQMQGDLLLTLLAYNIGPHNGGLRFIMDKYGAQNFAQAQPYLQELPRDYPIRVLSAALAYRLWKSQGDLPRYQEGEGQQAKRIQSLGVPGLDGVSPFAAFD